MIRQIIIFVLLIGFFSITYGQGSIDDKYLVSLIYLKSNKNAVSKIKKTFSYLTKKKDKCIDFNVSDQISFLPILFFGDQLEKQDIGIAFELVKDRNLYKEKFNFETYSLPYLKELIDRSDSRLILTFSKPIDNYLIAEFLDSELNISDIKMGHALQFLFKFSEEGLIEKVLYATPHYN